MSLKSANYTIVTAENNTKIAPGVHAKGSGFIDSYTLPGVVLAQDDEIDSLTIPEGATILDAFVKGPNLTTSGIVDMGLRAHVDIDGNNVAEDQDSLVVGADGGGQAFMKRANENNVGIGYRIGKGGAQVFLKCTEATVGTTQKIIWGVVYTLA